jgi:tetratricopeptide (TPR) repeat protein
MAKRKRKRPDKKPARELPAKGLAILREAQSMLRSGQGAEAVEKLEAYDRKHPNHPEIVAALLNAAYRLQDASGYLEAAERMVRLAPNNPDVHLALVGAYAMNVHPALAIRASRHFLERWPNHPQAAHIREGIGKFQPLIEEISPKLGASGEEALELAALHDEIQVALGRGHYAQTREIAARLLERRPQFIPALNNISEALAREGRLAEAAEYCRRVLELDPENFHALSNLTRGMVLAGRLEDAQALAQRLKAVKQKVPDAWIKKAEALSYLGDDEGVIEAWRGAVEAGSEGLPQPDALLLHLAAVAHYRQGKEDEARRLWEDALRRAPALEMARLNLADLRRPVAQRHAAWPFGIQYWMSKATLDALDQYLRRAGKGRTGDAATNAMRSFLADHLEIARLVPLLLDRGDESARMFAFHVAQGAKTPEMLTALRDFTLSNRGPDELRTQASAAATQAGLMPSGPIRMWIQGEWRDVLALGWEIHFDPDQPLPPEINELGIEAQEAMLDGDFDRAEQLYSEILAREPDNYKMQLNRAQVYLLLGREKEGEEMIQKIFEQHPDYLFARTHMARKAVKQGDLAKARELLKPLLLRKRLHISELNALVIAHVELELAEGRLEGAQYWIDMLARADRHSHNLPGLQAMVAERLGRPSWRW